MGRDVFHPLLLLSPGSLRGTSCSGLRFSGFCLQFTRVSLRRGLDSRRRQQCASRNLRRACLTRTRWENASGVDVRDSTGLDDDGGSRVLKAGGCAGNFCRMRFPPGFLRIACGSNCNARPTLPPRLGVFLDSEAQYVLGKTGVTR